MTDADVPNLEHLYREGRDIMSAAEQRKMATAQEAEVIINKGYEAGLAGKSRQSNPHVEVAKRKKLWLQGWEKGMLKRLNGEKGGDQTKKEESDGMSTGL